MRTEILLAALLASGCATIPEPSGGGENLPTAAAGPFRALVQAELGNYRSAPNGLDDDTDFGRDIAVLADSADPSDLQIVAYVAAAVEENGAAPTKTSPTRSIARYGALDGRSFDYSDEVVLTPDAAWEGGVLDAPAVLRAGGEIFLYYSAAGGIGLAKSADSHSFTKVPGPILAPASGSWEAGAVPASPGVVQLGDGSFRMFYQVAVGDGAAGATAIGEATSSDGVSWTRLGAGPALSASGAASGDVDGGSSPWDAASAGSPFPQLAVSADGRPILRVFYGARDAAGLLTIALAARYGTDGPLERAVSPVFGTTGMLDPREPCVVAFSGFTLLYATESSSSTDTHPAIAVGMAPATAALPPPDPM